MPSQAVMNQFVLVMFHMARGNTLARKVHILYLPNIIERIADDILVDYVTIIPIRPENSSTDGNRTTTLTV